MNERAYVDSSCLVAIALNEPGVEKVVTRLRSFVAISAHPLLDAEVRSVCARDDAALPVAFLEQINWIEARRPLSFELDRALEAGYLRGAECLHVAAALYISPVPQNITFLTLDVRQRAVAKKLGFKV